MKKILITGGDGMLANSLKLIIEEDEVIKKKDSKKRYLKYRKNKKPYLSDLCDFIFLGKDKLDITDISSVKINIQEISPDIIINMAAYTNVDGAEDEEEKLNIDINYHGVKNIIDEIKGEEIKFIQISTDYVFDGKSPKGYLPGDTKSPLNKYGEAKSLAEDYILKEYKKNSIIIRTSGLFGGGIQFSSFVNTMLKLTNIKRGDTLQVVNDQRLSFTFAKDLALALISIVKDKDFQKYHGEILHLVNEGEYSRFDLVLSMLDALSNNYVELIPVSSDKFPVKAKRPQNSILINDSDIKLRNIHEALKDYLYNL